MQQSHRPETLVALLEQRSLGEAVGFFDRERAVSWRELLDESARVAAGLRAMGVRRGDRVAIWLPNLTAWIACFFACARLGAIALAVNTRFRSAELADILSRSGSRVLVTWPGFDRTDFAGVLAGCPPESLSALAGLVAYAEPGDAAAPALRLPAGIAVQRYADLLGHAPLAEDASAPDAGCAIFTTSGTTKAPKFVLHDQRTLVAHAFDVVRGFDIDEASTMLLAPPLCGVFGVANALAMIAAGRPFLMMPAWD
ncbi:MAG TPA: AMP-binding protein, partial [Quisquiliibacterium sp.]|nr:AMP-binding protein [Quisquiliibacterium sp.]